jgi:phospholipid/cholesterol/gamma-HCH transport system substrate-binding protein
VRLDIDPAYVALIPANVHVTIAATTVFGNRYVSFTSPEDPTGQRISSSELIDVAGTSTEFNTLFETITSISEKVDPVRLNATLSAAAEALTGLSSAGRWRMATRSSATSTRGCPSCAMTCGRWPI